jgi:hypothetical protein
VARLIIRQLIVQLLHMLIDVDTVLRDTVSNEVHLLHLCWPVVALQLNKQGIHCVKCTVIAVVVAVA